jgi:hypothetical protein
MLTGAAGGTPARWREIVGEVTVLSLATHPACNWTVVPGGTDEEAGAVYKAMELVREEHPHARR